MTQESAASLQQLVKTTYNGSASCPLEPVENITKATALFGKLLSGTLSPEDIAQWDALEFKAYKQGSYLIVQEKEDKRRGAACTWYARAERLFFCKHPTILPILIRAILWR